jgi:hypothetical protein
MHTQEPIVAAAERPATDTITKETSDDGSCCGAAQQASCCEPSAKASCCAPSESGGCGCR